MPLFDYTHLEYCFDLCILYANVKPIISLLIFDVALLLLS
jgi:hypothetical protein